VSDTRKLLSDEFAQQMRVQYGLDPATGVVTDIDKLPTMAEGDRQTAQMLRDTLEHYLATAPKRDKKTIATTIDRIVREQAFTVLNRLCAVRMAESRELVIESIAQGTKSKGFQLYARLAGSALGETGEAYVCYLLSLFDELSIDLPVLFDRFSPSGRLFPRESVLLDVLGQINHHELQHLWAEDETIGWIYQYFNSQEERKAMRDESSAPRNSRELAVRNQFFTPRYVVEFLTDNTLGRIWYEMTQGQTRLVDNCKYLVRRPDEVFLSQMTNKDQEHPSKRTIAMAELLLAGTEETFPEFKADDPQPMIELAHCVSAYATMGDRAHDILGNRTLMVRERSVHEPTQVADAVEAAPYVFAGQPGMLKTQHILEVLFMTCRNDRHGGDGSVYSESWFVDACNEVRSRVLNSRRDDLTQEEQLRQPVFIPYRPMKDPRDIKMLDPACGSMHFGLYAFDLFLSIYEEAWELEESLGDRAFVRPRELKSLRDSYGTKERYMLDTPRLIIERNIHGVDIDARAVQIAGLSLWLRAQKAWHEARIKPNNRPQIMRSNIVCAEPMPGESELLEQFISDHLSQTSEQQTIASIVRRVFDAMKLAGDAGSLLKIDEEIADTIAEAKRKWVEGPKAMQLPLFSIDAKQKDGRARPLLVAGIDDASFWDEIEQRILGALIAYGDKSVSRAQHRLFAGDAARGFAFIDNARKRYDCVLTNPPFGDPIPTVRSYVRKNYEDGRNEIYAAFIIRAKELTRTMNGIVGAITSRSFLTGRDNKDFRKLILSDHTFALRYLLDLGDGVLDGAGVETAVYVVGQRQALNCLIFDNRDKADKSIDPDGQVRSVARMLFAKHPNHEILYDLDNDQLLSLATEAKLEPTLASVTFGITTKDNFRFVRLRWEVPEAEVGLNQKWTLFSKGGDYSWFSGDTHLVVNRSKNGSELAACAEKADGNVASTKRSSKHYFLPALTFSRRSQKGFSLRRLRTDVCFSDAGGAIIPNKDRKEWCLALLGVLATKEYMSVIRSQSTFGHYEVGSVKVLQAPNRGCFSIIDSVKEVLKAIDQIESTDETAQLFVSPMVDVPEILHRYSEAVCKLSESLVSIGHTLDAEVINFQREVVQGKLNKSTSRERYQSFALGVLFGRWNLMQHERPSVDLDPFEGLGATSPARLTVPPALDANEYPEFLEDDATFGMSVLSSKVNDIVIRCLGQEQSSQGLEQLNAKPFSCQTFFEFHLADYSRSRRESPIYWPLKLNSFDYTVWVYCHKLNGQTLFSIANEILDKRIEIAQKDIASLRSLSKRNAAQEANLEELTSFLSELTSFRSEMLAVAKFWKPNLNDGVQITAAPLWPFFQHRKWRETLKKTWEELEGGQYEWAHIALCVWPDRVIRSAHKDRSIAIAHDLENILWHEVEVKKTSKTGRVTMKVEWHPRELSEKELNAIAAKVKSGEFRSNNAVPVEVANG
jgi:hypothetical protein